jgi:hypothetical protein
LVECERILREDERKREEQRRHDELHKEEYLQQMRKIMQRVIDILRRLQYDAEWREDCVFCLQWIQQYVNQLDISIEMKEMEKSLLMISHQLFLNVT